MYKILSRSLSRSEKSLANFTNIYRRVAKNQLFHHRSTTSQTKNPHMENGESNSSEIKEKHTPRVKSSPSLYTKKGSNFLRRSLVPETKETIHIMMFSTSSSKYFYASTLNQAKESATSKKKYFKNHKALDLYKQALEQCMKIKFEKHRIQKGTSNVTWKPEPIRTNLLSDLSAPAKTKKKEALPPLESTKKIVRLHPKKSISVEEMKQLVRQKKASQVVKNKKFHIVYPTHMIKYKLGLQKPYQVEKSMAKNQDPLVSKPKPERERLEPAPKREINTVEVVPLKKRPKNNLEAVMEASRKRREKNDRSSIVVEVDEAIKQLISKHPAMKKVTESAKMSINKKYNIILLKSQAKLRLQMKPREVITETSENLELDRIPTDQNEVLNHSEPEVTRKSDIQKKLDADTSIVQHPIPTNLDQADFEVVIKCPKRLLSEKSETFDIEEICLKTKENYIVYTEEVADAMKKMSQDKEELKTVKEEVLDRIAANKEDYSPQRTKSPNPQKLKDIMMKNAKQEQSSNQIDQQKPTIHQNSGNSAQNLMNYIKKLNELKDQTSMERSSIQKPFAKTPSMVQKVEMNKVKNSGVQKEIIEQEQVENKETLTNKENVIDDQSNKKPMYGKLLEQSKTQKPVGQKFKFIPIPNKPKKDKEDDGKTVLSRTNTTRSPQSAKTVNKETSSKYLLENYKPQPITDDQSKEPLVQKTEAEVVRKKAHFQNIMNQYIVKSTSTNHEVEENPESKSRTAEQEVLKPVGNIIEKISREERRLYNKNKLTSNSEDRKRKAEQETFKPVEKISREDDNNKVESISEGAIKETEPKSLEPVEKTSREETTPYKDKLKNLLEPANQYLEKLREAGENQMKTLGALKDQFKNQLTENINKGLKKKKNMLENMPLIQENVSEDTRELPTKTFIVENLDTKKLKVPSMGKDSFLLLVKEPTQEEEDYDVIQIELRKKLKTKKDTDSSLKDPSEPISENPKNIESDKRNTLPNNRPTIRQDRPPQIPPTKNKNDKKEKPTRRGNIILPPSKPNERPRMSKNVNNRLDREEISMKKAEENRLVGYEGNLENSGGSGEKFDNLKQTNLAKCAGELENLENIVFKHEPRRKAALDADFIPEKFPNQQLFKNWLTILSDIEELEIEYKDGSDPKLIQLAKEMDIIEQNLNTEKNSLLTKKSQLEPNLDEHFNAIEEESVLEIENADQDMKMHPNWLHPEKCDAKKKLEFAQGNELIKTEKHLQDIEKSKAQRPVPEQFLPMNVVDRVTKTEKVDLGTEKNVKMDSRPLKMMDYEYSSKNLKVDEKKSKINHEAEIFHPKAIRKVKPKEDVALPSATKQVEDSKTKLSQKKLWKDSESIEKAKFNESIQSNTIKNSVQVSNPSSLTYSGPKLSMKKEWKQKTEQKSTSNILKKSEQWKPTNIQKTDSNASKKVEKSDNFVVILPHQNKAKVMEAVGVTKEKHKAKSETGLLRMYLLEENECYDEFISKIEKKTNPSPVKSISNDVEMNKSSLKPVWNENFKPKPVLDLSRKKLSTNLKSTENISGNNEKIRKPVEKPKFRRRSISDVTKSITKATNEGKLMKMYLLDESLSNEKLLRIQGKEKSKYPQKSSKDQENSVRKNILKDDSKKIDTSKKSNEAIQKTKNTKSLEELNKLNFPSYCFSDYLKAKKKRENKIKSETNKNTSREKNPEKHKSMVEVSPLESLNVSNKKNHTDLPNSSKSTEKLKLEKAPKQEEKDNISQVKDVNKELAKKKSDKETTGDIKSSKHAENENKMKKQVGSRESNSQILTRDNKLVCSNLISNYVSDNKSPNSPTKTNTELENEKNKKLPGPKSDETTEQPKIAVPKPIEKSDNQLKANSIKKTSIQEKNHSDVEPKKSTSIVANPRQKSSPILSKPIPPEDLAEDNKTKSTEVAKEKPEDKPTIPGKKQKVIIRLSRYQNSFKPTKPISKKKDTVPNTEPIEATPADTNETNESTKHLAKIKEILSNEPKTLLDYIIDDQLKKKRVKPEHIVKEAKILKQKYHNERLQRIMDKYRADTEKFEDPYHHQVDPAEAEILRQKKYKENALKAFKKKIDNICYTVTGGDKISEIQPSEKDLKNETIPIKQRIGTTISNENKIADKKTTANFQLLTISEATKLKFIARAKSSKYLLENQVKNIRIMKEIRGKHKNESTLMEKRKKNMFDVKFKIPQKGHKKPVLNKNVHKTGGSSNKYLLDNQLPIEFLISLKKTPPTEPNKRKYKPSTSKYLLENSSLVFGGKMKNDVKKTTEGTKKLHSDASAERKHTIRARISEILPSLRTIKKQKQFGTMIIETDLSSIFPNEPKWIKNRDRQDIAEIREIFHRRDKLLKFNKKLAEHSNTKSPTDQSKSVDSNLNKFLVTDPEKQKRYKKLFADFEKLERQIETQNQRPKTVLGTIVLRKIVEENEKPIAKLTMEKDLPKHPQQKKMVTKANAVKKCCDKLCVPPKSISQVFYSQPRDDITTLTKSLSDKILSVPKPAFKFDNYEKYKNLKISFITVRKPEKKNKSENFLPALLSIVEESKKKRENEKHLESNKAKMMAFRHEFLKKLKEEFDFLSENQNPSNFQKVCKHYEKVLKASTETNDNKSVLKLPMIQEKQKEKDGENKVSLGNMSLNPDHVPKNSTELLIKKLTAEESNDNEVKKAENPEKPKTDPKKK
ncbi:unnamed protein product [Phaedon cochleariae]|uniref:Uncharacterized protein n=1 Tax=Phaedon cochleariae TaxID=80249 RepID=A0A9P0GQA3_PHACE|nr:unnamed protein product [Phaedon cochleariae]